MKYADLTVDSLMTRNVVTTGPRTMAVEAERVMQDGGFRHLPVVSPVGELLGILSNRDLIRARALNRDGRIAVSEVMSGDILHFVRPSTRAREATWVMLTKKLGALPVLDGQRLVGMVTETDFLRIAHEVLGGDAISMEKE